MLNDVCIIGVNIVVFPGKNVRELLHEGAILEILCRGQMHRQIYVFWMGWVAYVMFTDGRLILYFGRIIGHTIMIEKPLKRDQSFWYVVVGQLDDASLDDLAF